MQIFRNRREFKVAVNVLDPVPDSHITITKWHLLCVFPCNLNINLIGPSDISKLILSGYSFINIREYAFPCIIILLITS